MSLRDERIDAVNQRFDPIFKALRLRYDSGELTLDEWEAELAPLRVRWEQAMDRADPQPPDYSEVARRARRRRRGECPECGRRLESADES